MTERKATTRRRRTTAGVVNIPRAIVDWFEGTRERRPWAAMAFPGSELLPDWWAAWSAQNPGARPPAGAEWLADPDDPRHERTGPAVETARALAAREAAA